MGQDAPPPWIILATAFIAIGICCAGLILTGPAWAHLVPDLPRFPTRSPTATPTQTPTVTLTPIPTFTLTPSPTLPAALRFPTLSPEDRYIPELEPTPAPVSTRPPPPNYRFPGQGDSVIRFSLSKGGAVRFVFSHTGERNFIVRLLDEGGNYAGGVANEIGNAEGETIEGLPPGEYFLEVEADGQWLINIIPP